MMLRRSLQIFLLLCLSILCVCQFTCDQYVDCMALGPGVLVPDPSDCHFYYVCTSTSEPTPSSIECASGEYFSYDQGICVQGEDCGTDQCPSLTTPNPTTCSVICGDVSNIPYPGNCNQFYSCDDPTGAISSCPIERPYFDGEFCVNDPTECCVVCSVECQRDFELVPDPTDCHNYTICGYGTTSCEQGEYFDAIINDCIPEDTECSSYCPDGIPSTSIPELTTTPLTTTPSTTTPPTTTPLTTTPLTTTPPTTPPPTTTPPTTTPLTTTPPTTTPLTTTPPTTTPLTTTPPTTPPPTTTMPTTTPPTTRPPTTTTPTTPLPTTTTPTTPPPTTTPPTTTPPTTTSQPTTSPTTTDILGSCMDNFVCPGTGDYVYCYSCTDTYYDCSTGIPVLDTCTESFVFDYSIGYCVRDYQCPVNP